MKNKNKNNLIVYGYTYSPFGDILIASNNNDIVYLSFVYCGNVSFAELKSLFKEFKFKQDDKQMHTISDLIFSTLPKKQPSVRLIGTTFQVQVWNALMKIPKGTLKTYTEVASIIGKPKSVRAVASAVAANHLAYLVPCHRVIPRSGGYGKYKWGENLKEKLIEWERSG